MIEFDSSQYQIFVISLIRISAEFPTYSMEEDILIQIDQGESETRWWITVKKTSVGEVTCDAISAVT